MLQGHLGVVRCLYIDKYKLVSGGDQKRLIVWDYRVSGHCWYPFLSAIVSSVLPSMFERSCRNCFARFVVLSFRLNANNIVVFCTLCDE